MHSSPQPLRIARAPLVTLALVLTPALATGVAAQTGPWTDGELLVRSVLPASQTQALYRVVPETGHGEELISGFYYGGWAGSLVFDPYRNAVLANFGLPPDSLFLYKLWRIAADGSATAIPGFTGATLQGLAPIGDGRVYYQHRTPSPPYPIQYLDGNDAIHTLLDATGTVPFELSVEHMLYHAPTNSLLASTSAWWSPNDCTENESSLYRIPLSQDGSRVAGPIACASVSGENSNVMSLDYLPGGDVLVSMSGAQYFQDTQRRVNPYTLMSTVWASPSPVDLNGGVWSSRLGRVVVLDDTSNTLRSYGPGQSGAGLVLPTDFTVSPTTTGFSPHETLTEIDLGGPGCIGESLSLGPGLAGSGNLVPSLAVSGCPDVGVTFELVLENGRGGALGWLALGFGSAPTPLFGGTLYPSPVASLIPITLGGAPGIAGAGSLALPVTFTVPALSGLTLDFQGLFLDPGAPQLVSMTNGLWLSIG